MLPHTSFLLIAVVLAATLLWFVRSTQRAALKRELLEPERLASVQSSPRRVRSSRPRRRPPTAVKQSALLPGRHAGQ